MSQEFEVVVRQGKPYLRRKPFTYESPTLRQQVMRGKFAKIAYDLFDQVRGYKDGLPIVAAKEKEAITGLTVPRAPKVLEMTPFQYVALLMRIEERQMKGEKISLPEILRQRNIAIRIVEIPKIEVVVT